MNSDLAVLNLGCLKFVHVEIYSKQWEILFRSPEERPWLKV